MPERYPLGRPRGTALDTPAIESRFDGIRVDAEFRKSLREEVGHLAVAELGPGEPPQTADAEFARPVDAQPRTSVDEAERRSHTLR